MQIHGKGRCRGAGTTVLRAPAASPRSVGGTVTAEVRELLGLESSGQDTGAQGHRLGESKGTSKAILTLGHRTEWH